MDDIDLNLFFYQVNILSGEQDPKSEKTGRTVILGVGNILLQDEGIGVHVIRELQKKKLPPNVEAIDGATQGLDLLYVIEGADRLIIVDCLKTDEEKPGTIFRFKPEEVEGVGPEQKLSLHDVSLTDVLEIASFLGTKPDTVIFGVEAKVIDWGLEPTPELKAKIPELVKLVLKEIAVPDEKQEKRSKKQEKGNETQ